MAVHFDSKKFQELVLYVADRSVDDPHFGATKLNKILFYSDFAAYASLGSPITGADYQKLEHGPAPRQYKPIERDLLLEGAAALTPVMRFTYTQQRLTALREPNLNLFSGEEIAIVDQVIGALRNANAAEVSERSHGTVGWRAASVNETIPYGAAFLLAPTPLTEDEEAVAQALANEHGLLAPQ
jgi:hypothetical protein